MVISAPPAMLPPATLTPAAHVAAANPAPHGWTSYRVKPGDTTPMLIPLSAFATNIGVSFLNAAILSWPAIASSSTRNTCSAC